LLNKLIFANLTHRPVRTLLSVLAIAVEVTMILTLVGVSHGTLDSSAERARGVGADIVVRPPGTSVMSSLSSSPLSEKYIPLLEQQPHVKLATGTVIASLTFPDSITGLDFPSFEKMSGGFTYLDGGDPVNDNDMTVDRYYAQQKFIGVVIGVAVIVGFIVVFMAMYTAVLERTREIGILKAVGSSNAMILSILLRETFMLAIIGTLVGILLTYASQWMMKHFSPGSLVQETVYYWWPIAGAIAIVGALLGAVMPGYKAVQQDVTEALSYE
jgi:ABC-type antimicrobial peptide transport system permease subunit